MTGRNRPLIKWRILAVVGALLVGGLGCETRLERELSSALRAANNGEWRTALTRFDQILKMNAVSEEALKAAREGARVAYFEVKDYYRSLSFYQHLALYSPNPEEVLGAQRQIVEVYLEHLLDYEKAIIEIGKLLQIETDPSRKVDLKLNSGRAHFHLKRFMQAHSEIEDGLRWSKDSQQSFQLKLMKANIFIGEEKYPPAVAILKELMEQDRSQAFKDNVPLTLAGCFEEMKDYGSAIALFQGIRDEHPIPEYVDVRIKRLQERFKNLPRSLRK